MLMQAMGGVGGSAQMGSYASTKTNAKTNAKKVKQGTARTKRAYSGEIKNLLEQINCVDGTAQLNISACEH